MPADFAFQLRVCCGDGCDLQEEQAPIGEVGGGEGGGNEGVLVLSKVLCRTEELRRVLCEDGSQVTLVSVFISPHVSGSRQQFFWLAGWAAVLYCFWVLSDGRKCFFYQSFVCCEKTNLVGFELVQSARDFQAQVLPSVEVCWLLAEAVSLR